MGSANAEEAADAPAPAEDAGATLAAKEEATPEPSFRGIFCEVSIAVDHTLSARFITSSGALVKAFTVESKD